MGPEDVSGQLPRDAVRTALRAFRELLVRGELTERDPELLNAVLADPAVAEVFGVIEETLGVRILRGRNRVDLSPEPDNHDLGFRYVDIRARFNERTGMAYLVVLGLLALFFRSGNFRVPDFDYVEVFDLEEFITRKAQAVVERGEARVGALEGAAGTGIFEPCREWLERDKFKEGRGYRSTRYGVIQATVSFLVEQGLLHRESTVGRNARLYPTEKLKAQAETLAHDDRYRLMMAVLQGDEETLARWEAELPGPEPEPRPEAKPAKPRARVLDLFGGSEP